MELQFLARTADIYILEHGLGEARESDCFEDLCTRMGSLLLFEEVGSWEVIERAMETPDVKYTDMFNKQLKKAYVQLKTKKADTSTSDATRKIL